MKYKFCEVLIDDIEATTKALEELRFTPRYNPGSGELCGFIKNLFPYYDSEKPCVEIQVCRYGDAHKLTVNRKHLKFGRHRDNTNEVVYTLVRLAEMGLIRTNQRLTDSVF